MKIQTKILNSALKDLSPLAKSRATSAFSSMVKIETHDRMKLSCSDGDQFMTREIEFSGEIATIALNLNQFLYSLGDAEETTILQETGCIIVKCGQKVSRLQTMDAAEFPAMPNPLDFKLVGVNATDLSIGLKAVHGFERKADIGTTLICTQIKGSSKSITFTAADGSNVAHFASALISADFEILVPSEFCDSLAEALGSNNAQLTLSSRGAYIVFDGGSYYCKLSEGKFPSSSIFTDKKMDFLGFLDTKPLMDEISSRIHFANPGEMAGMELEFSGKGISTKFYGKDLENQMAGDFQPYKARVSCEAMMKCLGAIGKNCKVYAEKDCMKFTNGDLSIWSMNLRGNP